MGEGIDLGPSPEIELDPRWKELEAGAREPVAPFTLQHGVEFLP